MNSENLKFVIRQFVERKLPVCRQRQLVIPLESGKVVGLAGVRRSGKTFLFFDAIQRLAVQGVARERILYLNFEDDRLNPVLSEELDQVLRCWHELYPEVVGQRTWLFLDEVQNVAGWERWVRRLCDTEDLGLFVTGSSSALMTRDLATALRGRSITLEVFPLSFSEYLSFRGIPVINHDADNESLLRYELEAYLLCGGFPEIVLADETLRPLIHGEYASLMLYRDLVEHYGVRNEKLMRELLRYCFRNSGSLLNVSKLYRDFTSLGFSVSKNTLFDYLGYLEDAFLIFLVPRLESSLRKQEHNPKKLHVIDTGLMAAFQAFPQRDLGHKLETVVFLENRRRSKELFYYSNGSEVDLCDGQGSLFINSCWSLTDPETMRREQAALKFGAAHWQGARGLLLYHEFPAGQLPPEALPAWSYLTGSASLSSPRPS